MNTSTPLSRRARQSRTGSTGWHMQVLAGRLNRLMRARLDEHGLKLEHFILLTTLAEEDNLTQTELGKRVNLAHYSVSRALDTLEEMGLVERHADAHSRRAHRVFLTRAGQAIMPQLFDVVTAVNAGFHAPLDPAERDTLHALLAKLLAAGPSKG